MSKLLNATIEQCGGCPYYKQGRSFPGERATFMCGYKMRETNGDELPPWCPLPDVSDQPVSINVGNWDVGEYYEDDVVLKLKPVSSQKVAIVPLERYDAVQEALEAVKQWWDRLYPEDVFKGESGDEGAIRVVEIREKINKCFESKAGDGQ